MAFVRALIACGCIVVFAGGQPRNCEHGTLQYWCLARIGPLAVVWERGFATRYFAPVSASSIGGAAPSARIDWRSRAVGRLRSGVV